MVRRMDQNDLDIEIKELNPNSRKVVIASVEDSKTEAEIEALQHRLNGRKAFIQNGFQGKYEVLTSENRTEIRKLTADFTEVGCGVYRANNPDWDKGSLWNLYAVESDGTILISRREDEDEDSREALTSGLQVKSNISGRTAAPLYIHNRGDVLEFIDTDGRFAQGTVVEVDHASRGYWVQSDLSFDKEFVPFSLTAGDEAAFTSDDPGADDDFDFVPDADNESAYTSDDPGADDDYVQNENDEQGFESMDEFDQSFGDLNENQMHAEASLGDEGTESGLDDIQTLNMMGDGMYDDGEDETNQVGGVVEADHQLNFEGYDEGLDDMFQECEDMQESEDHYDFDDELYALASASTEDGLDDTPQTTEDLQSEQGEEDQHFQEVDDMQNSVGSVVDTPESYDLSELMEVQREQMAKRDQRDRDTWFI